ncbi:6-phospho-3-hexuloisomerase [Winogradskya consettensis]|nr:6-phospho-3-hexuloisomerase [Actinoplanes consettensis]
MGDIDMSTHQSVQAGCVQAVNEVEQVAREMTWQPWEELPALLRQARAVFLVGNGRSGFVARMAAMRLMHVGLATHVVGETTTPAIAADDVLIAVSGSGSTNAIVYAARQATDSGATVVAVTANPGSDLAKVAKVVLLVPAPEKTDHGDARGSQQYAGSLFEQVVLFAFEGVFNSLWQASGTDAGKMYKRHANLG